MIETKVLGDDRQFPATEWALLRREPRMESLDILARRYWKPLYFYVRRHRFDVETSKDIVQSFLASLLAHDTVARADPGLGRFRTFILAALSNFIKDWTRATSRLKRGGGQAPLSLDFPSVEAEFSPQLASHEETPEVALNRAWARSLLEQSVEDLKGAPAHLQAFRMYLDGECYESISKQTGMSQSASKVAVHRLRGKLRRLLIARIADTVGTEADLKAELSEFVGLLS